MLMKLEKPTEGISNSNQLECLIWNSNLNQILLPMCCSTMHRRNGLSKDIAYKSCFELSLLVQRQKIAHLGQRHKVVISKKIKVYDT